MNTWMKIQKPRSSRSEGPALAGHLNGVSDSCLIRTNRGGLVSPQDPGATSCPSALGLGQGDTVHASLTQSTHCCLCGNAIPLTTPLPSLSYMVLVTGKASLALRTTPLCAALCRHSCASRLRPMRRWEAATCILSESLRYTMSCRSCSGRND